MIDSTSVGLGRTVQGNTTLNDSKSRISGGCKKVAMYALKFLPRLILAVICSPAALFGQKGRKFALSMWNTLRFNVQSKELTRIQDPEPHLGARILPGISSVVTVHAGVSDSNLVSIINLVKDSGFNEMVHFTNEISRFQGDTLTRDLDEDEKAALCNLLKKYSQEDLSYVSLNLTRLATTGVEELKQRNEELSSNTESTVEGELERYIQISKLLDESQKLFRNNLFADVQTAKIQKTSVLKDNLTLGNLIEFLRVNVEDDIMARN
jgi:hypothetical protein